MDIQKANYVRIKSWLGSGSINIFGRQFAGKDTQCALLAKNLDGITFSGGDILRSGNTPDHVMAEVNAGNLSPTEEFRAIITPYLAKKEFDGAPLFLSSVGRMKGEETVIIDAAKKSGHEIKAAIFIDINEATTWERFTRSRSDGTRELRADDDEKGITKRLKLYDESTIPVIDFYRNLGLVIDIDGSQNPSIVFDEIISKLLLKASSK